MKKIVAIMISVFMIVSAMTGLSAFAAGEDYTATKDWGINQESGKFEISSVGDFIAFNVNALTNNYYQGKEVIITNDIIFNPNWDASTKSEQGVEYTWTPMTNFKGVLDGQGHTISGFYVKGTDNFQGIFATTGGPATFKNLKIMNTYIQSDAAKNHHGGLVGQVKGGSAIFENIYSEAIVGYTSSDTTKASSNVGGFVGVASSETTFNNCVFAGEVEAKIRAAGFVGNLGSLSVLTDCVNMGKITVLDNDEAAGFLGRVNADAYLTRCFNAGEINATGNLVSAFAVLYQFQSLKNVVCEDSWYLTASSTKSLCCTENADNQKFSVTVVYTDGEGAGTGGAYKCTAGAEAGTTSVAVQNLISSIDTIEAFINKPGMVGWCVADGKVMLKTMATMIGANVTAEGPTEIEDENDEYESTESNEDTEDTDSATTPKETTAETAEEEKSGCGSAIGFATVSIIAVACGVGIVVRKRDE